MAEVGDGVLNRAVFESEQGCQLLLVEFLDTLGDVVLKNKIEKHLLLGAKTGVDIDHCVGGADFAGEGGFGVGDMGQQIKKIAVFGIDDLLHFGQLFVPETCLSETFEQAVARCGSAPDCAEFVFAGEELRQPAEELLEELLRGHRRAIRMPEGRGHHVLDASLFPVGQFDLGFLALFAKALNAPTDRTNFFGALAGALATGRAGFGRGIFALAGIAATLVADLRLGGFSIPFRIAEVNVRLYEIMNREVVLAVIETRSSADELFEFDHRVDRAHEDDVSHIAGIHTCREFLGGGEDRWDGLFVILKVAEILLAERAVIRRDALAVVRVFARFELVDEIADRKGMGLVCAEDEGFFVGMDLGQENLDALFLAFLDLEDAVEIRLFVTLAGLDLALHHGVVGCINIFVERGGDLLQAKWRQKSIIDAVLERVNIDRIAEVGVGVHIVLAPWRGGETELHGGRKVVENATPVALVVRSAAMALVDDDEVEKIWRVVAKIRAVIRPR